MLNPQQKAAAIITNRRSLFYHDNLQYLLARLEKVLLVEQRIT